VEKPESERTSHHGYARAPSVSEGVEKASSEIGFFEDWDQDSHDRPEENPVPCAQACQQLPCRAEEHGLLGVKPFEKGGIGTGKPRKDRGNEQPARQEQSSYL
jgi:hypothetical protein